MEANEAKSGLYVYAVVPDVAIQDLGAIGLEGRPVVTLAETGLRIVVSEYPNLDEKLRPERRHVAAHEGVVQKLVERSPAVLPFAFGTVADDEEGIKTLVHEHADELHEALERVKGKGEMTVRLTYTGPLPVLQYVVNQRPDLQAARDELFGGGREPSRDEKLDLGRSLEGALDELRTDLGDRFKAGITSVSEASKDLPPRNENELLRLACLVSTSAVERFHAVIDDLASQLGDEYVVEVAGPVAPYDFTEMRLSMGADGPEVHADR